MNFYLTLEMILDLPNQMRSNSEKYNEFSELLRKEIYSDYNIKDLKEYITKMFNRFKDLKYLCNYSLEDAIKITSSYNFDEIKKSNNISNQIEEVVSKNIDDKIWLTKFYQILLTTSSKLTIHEVEYLISHFFGNKSEDVISEKLGVCKVTLQNVKKSCFIKLYNELKALD